MIVRLNGRFMDEKEAAISPLDRGFLYGEGVFETIRCYAGTPFAFNEHIKRMRKGLKALSIELTFKSADMLRAVGELLRKNRLNKKDAYLRITVSRGVTGGLKDFRTLNPTCFMHCREIDTKDLSQKRKNGIRVGSVKMRRDFIPELKHLNYMPSIIALLKINEKKGKGDAPVEAIFVDDRGNILEGATSNIFFYNDTEIVTPPAAGILPGIMRDSIIKAFKKAGITVKEKAAPLKSLNDYTGAFITNSIIEMMPVRQLDDKTFSLEEFTRFYELFRKQCLPPG